MASEHFPKAAASLVAFGAAASFADQSGITGARSGRARSPRLNSPSGPFDRWRSIIAPCADAPRTTSGCYAEAARRLFIVGSPAAALDARNVTGRGRHVISSGPTAEKVEKLALRVHSDLAKEVREVVPDRARAQVHVSGDLAHAFAPDQPVGDLQLPSRDVFETRQRGGVCSAAEGAHDSGVFDLCRDAPQTIF